MRSRVLIARALDDASHHALWRPGFVLIRRPCTPSPTPTITILAGRGRGGEEEGRRASVGQASTQYHSMGFAEIVLASGERSTSQSIRDIEWSTELRKNHRT